MLRVRRVKNGYILYDNNGNHAHGSKKYCNKIRDLILARRKPTEKDIVDNHDIEYMEESILRFVSESRYRRWGKTKKYVNKPKHVRRIV